MYIPPGTFDESSVCKRSITEFTEEAIRMPAGVHCLDDSANNELLCRHNINSTHSVFQPTVTKMALAVSSTDKCKCTQIQAVSRIVQECAID